MKIKFTFLAILALISATTFSQRLSLELYSNVNEENKFLSSIDYNKNFNSNEELIKEVERIVENLEKSGFIKASIKSIKEVCKIYLFVNIKICMINACSYLYIFLKNYSTINLVMVSIRSCFSSRFGSP